MNFVTGCIKKSSFALWSLNIAMENHHFQCKSMETSSRNRPFSTASRFLWPSFRVVFCGRWISEVSTPGLQVAPMRHYCKPHRFLCESLDIPVPLMKLMNVLDASHFYKYTVYLHFVSDACSSKHQASATPIYGFLGKKHKIKLM